MADDRIVQYIQTEMKKGFLKDDIKKALLKANHRKEIIADAFEEVGKRSSPASHKLPSSFQVFVVVFILCVAGVFLLNGIYHVYQDYTAKQSFIDFNHIVNQTILTNDNHFLINYSINLMSIPTLSLNQRVALHEAYLMLHGKHIKFTDKYKSEIDPQLNKRFIDKICSNIEDTKSQTYDFDPALFDYLTLLKFCNVPLTGTESDFFMAYYDNLSIRYPGIKFNLSYYDLNSSQLDN